MRTVLTAEKLWNGSGIVEHPVVVIEDGRIASIGSRAAAEAPNGNGDHRLEFPGATLAPAFLDVHIHGAAGHDVMEATPDALKTMGRLLASHGTGSYLATTVTAPLDATLKSLSGLARLLAQPPDPAESVTWPIGIHLEGPFLSHAKRGVHPPGLLLDPDISVFDKLYEAAEGHVRLMTLAPELPEHSNWRRTPLRAVSGCRWGTPMRPPRRPAQGLPPALLAPRTPLTPCARWITASPEFWALFWPPIPCLPS